MVKEVVYLILIFSLSCCNIRFKQISPVSHEKVPKDSLFFKKKYDSRYSVILPNGVNTSCIYYRYKYYYMSYNGDRTEKFYNTDSSFISAFRFYDNGRVSLFVYYYRKKILFDPEKRGYRGVCYLTGNKLKLSLVTQVTSFGKYGIRNYNIEVSKDKDTLFLYGEEKYSIVRVYIRKKIKMKTNVNLNW